jgi:hypothetical protein
VNSDAGRTVPTQPFSLRKDDQSLYLAGLADITLNDAIYTADQDLYEKSTKIEALIIATSVHMMSG